MLIDSHAHLSFKDYSRDEIDTLLQKAKEEGVEAIINIGAGESWKGNEEALKLAKQYPYIYATAGMHPHDAKEVNDKLLSDLEKLAQHPKVVAIGEVGLDYYYENSEREVQKNALKEQIRLAKKIKLPLSIHVRDAYEDLLKIFDEEKAYDAKGVIHCFSGDENFARRVIDNGFYISFSGIVTFKKSLALQEVARVVPLDSMMIETDAPYLSPEPYRGKRNQPAWVKQVAIKLAELKQVSFEELAQVTTRNVKQLFALNY